MITQEKIQMAARLYEIRDAAKTILGDDYKSRMAELAILIRNTSQKENLGIIQAATKLCQTKKWTAMGIIAAMAAAVELIEPST